MDLTTVRYVASAWRAVAGVWRSDIADVEAIWRFWLQDYFDIRYYPHADAKILSGAEWHGDGRQRND